MDEKNSSRMTSLGTHTIANGWISFAADPGQKERCLARLREGELGPDNQPSDCAAGGKHRFSDELGVPETLAVVIDVLCWLRQSEGKISARAQAIDLIEAIPVGVDLGPASQRYAHWLLHDTQWGIAQYCATEPLKGVAARLKVLHDKELAGLAIDDSEWPVLAPDTPIETGAADEEDGRHLEDLFASFATPLQRIDVEQMGRLCGAVAYFAGEQARSDFWTDSEQRQMDDLYGAFCVSTEQILGPRPPPQQTAELKDWIRHEQALDAAWEKQMRQQQWQLWRRWDAWGEKQAALYAAFNGAAVDLILSLFKQAPRRDVLTPGQQLH
ncbi:hypothetical protein SAMN04515618_103252 [Collimonas sp. OK307]|nr:hypothetical protein SAMN04515618_103252 [Collimonas sp. OK307]